MFSVTKNRNIRIPRYGQVCRGTYHAKEIPWYTGVPVFFPNLNRNEEIKSRQLGSSLRGALVAS